MSQVSERACMPNPSLEQRLVVLVSHVVGEVYITASRLSLFLRHWRCGSSRALSDPSIAPSYCTTGAERTLVLPRWIPSFSFSWSITREFCPPAHLFRTHLSFATFRPGPTIFSITEPGGTAYLAGCRAVLTPGTFFIVRHGRRDHCQDGRESTA